MENRHITKMYCINDNYEEIKIVFPFWIGPRAQSTPYLFVQFETQRYCLQLSSTAENLFHIV